MIEGSTPHIPVETILAIGFKLYFLTASSEATSTAAAPSFMVEALPAVTEPAGSNAGRSLLRTSREESPLTPSS